MKSSSSANNRRDIPLRRYAYSISQYDKMPIGFEMSVDTPTDRPKPVRNCCYIEVFLGIFNLLIFLSFLFVLGFLS